MTAQQHDASLAAVSHMPHLLAFAFMNSIVRQPRSNELLELAGSGFRDFSRIAGSEPAMWRDIFSANRDELQMQISLFKQHLTALETALQENNVDSIETLIARASNGRRKWQASDEAQHLFNSAD
jgi:prephenate dehydrogenase